MNLANLRENKKTNAIKSFILLTSSMGLLYMLKHIFEYIKYIWTELKMSIILYNFCLLYKKSYIYF